MAQCTAKSKRSQVQCRNAAVTGCNTCRMHGGTAKRGPDHPSWVDGRRSKVLHKRLRDDYETSRGDENTLVLLDEIGLLDARINDLLTRVDTGESRNRMIELRQTWREYEAAKNRRDTDGMAQWLRDHGRLVKEMASDYAAWESVLDVVDRRRRLVDSERKRLVAAQEMIHKDRALAMMALLVETVLPYVHNDADRLAIGKELERLTA